MHLRRSGPYDLRMTPAPDLFDWLREAIADIEATANDRDPWRRMHGPYCGILDEVPTCDCNYATTVLDQCEAHTKLLDLHATSDAGECGVCSDGTKGFCSTVKLVAACYRQYDGFDLYRKWVD